MDTPSRKARHNSRVRDRLLSSATRLVRAGGPHAPTIDAICAGAGFTRGAFYAHFASKAAILAAVARTDPPLLTALRGRSAATPDALWLGLRHLLDAVLHDDERAARLAPAILPDAALPKCARPESMAAEPAAGGAHDALLAEMARGAPVPAGHSVYPQVLALLSGAQQAARALPPGDGRAATVGAARQAIAQLLDAAEVGAAPLSGLNCMP